jgi:hypothetical protein
MLFPFMATDWYWIVGGGGPHLDQDGNYTGDESQVFSSASNAYVPATDATYVAWKDRDPNFDATTRIDTEANLALVLEPFGIIPNFSRRMADRA